MRPYLVGSLKGPDLANISTTVGYQQRRAVSPQVAAKLTELMVGAEKVAQQKGAIPGVQIASRRAPPNMAPTLVTLHRTLGTSPLRPHKRPRWLLPCWWRTGLIGCPPPEVPSRHRSGGR